MKILVFGVSGMLGKAVFSSLKKNFDVRGTLRSPSDLSLFDEKTHPFLIAPIDAMQEDVGIEALFQWQPDVVINCIGVIKQLEASRSPLLAISLNALWPHRLSILCQKFGARLIHISTDCVFSGVKGSYTEDDLPDARDLYGLSKLMGEIDAAHAITLRTSIIGHELKQKKSLLEWFLSQKGDVTGYTEAIFSGLPTVELARVVKDFVIPNPHLKGLYHVSSEPINKYDLLTLIAKIYNKNIDISKDTIVKIDRSLCSARFRKETGYEPPLWPQLIEEMHKDYVLENGNV